jgi:hypothetical protein
MVRKRLSRRSIASGDAASLVDEEFSRIVTSWIRTHRSSSLHRLGTITPRLCTPEASRYAETGSCGARFIARPHTSSTVVTKPVARHQNLWNLRVSGSTHDRSMGLVGQFLFLVATSCSCIVKWPTTQPSHMVRCSLPGWRGHRSGSKLRSRARRSSRSPVHATFPHSRTHSRPPSRGFPTPAAGTTRGSAGLTTTSRAWQHRWLRSSSEASELSSEMCWYRDTASMNARAEPWLT